MSTLLNFLSVKQSPFDNIHAIEKQRQKQKDALRHAKSRPKTPQRPISEWDRQWLPQEQARIFRENKKQRNAAYRANLRAIQDSTSPRKQQWVRDERMYARSKSLLEKAAKRSKQAQKLRNKPCKDSKKVRSSSTGRCVKKSKPCNAGQYRNHHTGRCQKQCKPGYERIDRYSKKGRPTSRCFKECKAGTSRNLRTKMCRKTNKKVPVRLLNPFNSRGTRSPSHSRSRSRSLSPRA